MTWRRWKVWKNVSVEKSVKFFHGKNYISSCANCTSNRWNRQSRSCRQLYRSRKGHIIRKVTCGYKCETSFKVEQFICNLHQFDKLTCRCDTVVSRQVLPKDWQIQIVNKNPARGFAIRRTKAMYCYTLSVFSPSSCQVFNVCPPGSQCILDIFSKFPMCSKRHSLQQHTPVSHNLCPRLCLSFITLCRAKRRELNYNFILGVQPSI